MDMICPVCGEPLDNDELHEVDGMTYEQAAHKFRIEGCGVLFGRRCEPANSVKTLAATLLYEMLGDDMDGAASMMDDFEYLGMLD